MYTYRHCERNKMKCGNLNKMKNPSNLFGFFCNYYFSVKFSISKIKN